MKGNQHLNGLTFILAVFHFIAMYLYKYLSSDVIFWNVNGKENKIFQFFGGISPIDSSNLVCVILYILPVYVFCIYIGNFFVKELKKNVVFLLLRNGNRIKWLQKMLYQVFLYTSYYEILFLFMVIIMQLGYGGITIYYVKELIFLFTFEFLRTLCFSFLSSICFFFFFLGFSMVRFLPSTNHTYSSSCRIMMYSLSFSCPARLLTSIPVSVLTI